ncbi:MAG: VanZ family protein [Rubrivivax sp.]|nr:VanZ family protein [Rubrivivax sp.]
MSQPVSEPPFRLARLALAVVVPIVAYASLRPFSGWRDNGRAPFAYLVQVTQIGSLFDVALNVVGYVVLAFVLVLALFPRWRGARALAFGSLVPALCSVLVEATQNYLPGRTPSAIDVLANSAGALIGALAAVRLTPWLRDHRGGRQWRARWLAPGHGAEAGLVLLAAWWLVPFAQRTLLVASGDFRGNLQVAVLPGVPAFVYVAVEVFVVAANAAAAGLLLRLVLAEGRARLRWFALLLAGALALRWVARFSFWNDAGWQWLTPSALAGAALAVVVVWRAQRLPRRAAALLAIVLLAAAVMVVNVAPPDPALWLEGTAPRETNLIALALVARYTAKAWPFAAIAFLWLAARAARARS